MFQINCLEVEASNQSFGFAADDPPPEKKNTSALLKMLSYSSKIGHTNETIGNRTH